MPASYTWSIAEVQAASDAVVASGGPLDRALRINADAHLGHGIVRPLRRDRKNDFVRAVGEQLVRAAVGQILGTQCSSEFSQGETPWRPEFGSLLYRLRHMANDAALSELGRIYVVEALQRWEPRVRVKSVVITRRENLLEIRLRYDITASGQGNEVIVPDINQISYA